MILWLVLIACSRGEAEHCVCNPERTWKQVVSHFDLGLVRTGRLHTRESHIRALTSRKPKTLQHERNIIQTWEKDGAQLEMKYAKKAGEDAKISALTSIMPETWFGEAGVSRGSSFNVYTDLRTTINYLDDKSTLVDHEVRFLKFNDEHGAESDHKNTRRTR